MELPQFLDCPALPGLHVAALLLWPRLSRLVARRLIVRLQPRLTTRLPPLAAKLIEIEELLEELHLEGDGDHQVIVIEREIELHEETEENN